MRANFEFIGKLGVNFWCFHDRDIALDGKTRGESIFKFLHLIAILRQDQSVRCSGICLLFFIYGIFSYDHSWWNVLCWLILCCYIFKFAFWVIGLHLLSLSQESKANLDLILKEWHTEWWTCGNPLPTPRNSNACLLICSHVVPFLIIAVYLPGYTG